MADHIRSTSSVPRLRAAVAFVVILLLALAVSTAGAPFAGSDRPLRDHWLDAWLTMKISAQYAVDADVSSRDVRVDTFDGHVTLSGPIASTDARWQAVAIARSTDGVRDVADRLWVPGHDGTNLTGMRRDESIITRLRAAYFNDPELKHESISVASSDGRVELAGAVATTDEQHRAIELAWRIKGVESVDAKHLAVIARVPQSEG